MPMLSQKTRRLGVAEAKSKLSEVLRDAAQGPLVIHSRGRDLAVVLAVEEYERLTAGQQPSRAGGSAFLQRVEALKLRHDGGVDDFEPARLDFVPANPFARSKTGRR
jgi:prevent-host-death family protein